MIFSINEQSNYLAQVVKLDKPVPHPNADKLEGFVINGNTVWYSKGLLEKDDIVVYFPIECQIDSKILSELNLFNDKTLNKDPNAHGYFNAQGRVKAVRLRGEPSEGFIIPIGELINAVNKYSDLPRDMNYYNGVVNDMIGSEFDTIWGIHICKKYEPVVRNSGTNPQRASSKVKLKDILVEGQFRFHRDTPKLTVKTLEHIPENKYVYITKKLHGTSAVFANLLVKKKLNIFQKIAKWLGFDIEDKEYKRLYSSRSVIKYIEDYYHTEKQGYYNTDVWAETYNKIKDYLQTGITIYGEIVGYTPTGSYIQKGYDYGCAPNTSEFYIYRMTYTDENGKTFELSRETMEMFSKASGIKIVPALSNSNGLLLLQLYREYVNSKHKKVRHDELFNALKKQFLEKDCDMCKNKVPDEGVVIHVDCGEAFKLKSFRFLEKESKDLDSEDQSENLELNDAFQEA